MGPFCSMSPGHRSAEGAASPLSSAAAATCATLTKRMRSSTPATNTTQVQACTIGQVRESIDWVYEPTEVYRGVRVAPIFPAPPARFQRLPVRLRICSETRVRLLLSGRTWVFILIGWLLVPTRGVVSVLVSVDDVLTGRDRIRCRLARGIVRRIPAAAR